MIHIYVATSYGTADVNVHTYLMYYDAYIWEYHKHCLGETRFGTRDGSICRTLLFQRTRFQKLVFYYIVCPESHATKQLTFGVTKIKAPVFCLILPSRVFARTSCVFSFQSRSGPLFVCLFLFEDTTRHAG